jgi:CheY-like chemotaxis protein/predicted transcriptional regulator
VPEFGAFSFDVTKRILDVLKQEGPLKRTNLATKAGLNYNVCARYLALLSAINWIRMDPDVSITETGRRISDVLIDSESLRPLKAERSQSAGLEQHEEYASHSQRKVEPPDIHKKSTIFPRPPTTIRAKRRANGDFPKVMIVDDEHDVALTFQSFLSGICDASIFSNPYDALKEFASRAKDIELVVLDIRIPEMNGLQLYRSLAAINKECKFLFVSALDAAGELLSLFPEIRQEDIIKKPVERTTFNQAVTRKLSKMEN